LTTAHARRSPAASAPRRCCCPSDEDATLLGCTKETDDGFPLVPLSRRVYWAFLTREGMREGEAIELRWGDVDLEVGGVTLDENKTNDPRSWALDPRVVAALKACREVHPLVEEGIIIPNGKGKKAARYMKARSRQGQGADREHRGVPERLTRARQSQRSKLGSPIQVDEWLGLTWHLYGATLSSSWRRGDRTILSTPSRPRSRP
jgi:integrase